MDVGFDLKICQENKETWILEDRALTTQTWLEGTSRTLRGWEPELTAQAVTENTSDNELLGKEYFWK
jgi:hypothetical protein